ncbi:MULTISPECIES: TIGR03086 family metal-binding protein [unclassified Curtobacterium]|uniref:TIGR03086 family metal-binding protein n=1 Tax=unclassified Curtobacterium TaxID=257496 RepID=UPI0008DD3E9D|nr:MULTISPECIES: TIGR03086 family metal-binding protein [unclassified Curtobacterium]OIH96870.1 TIGR03086 family protein [Curtobacterium sp. MCBA15_003]OII09368.1 TIGR03086 family protein [Curtobacterium sp. MCBA15_009]OII29068.1 TIGR03086 family protein [Curtobacterium sp. MMLR14_006]
MATDWIAMQALAAAEFGRRVAAVTDWDAPTPDSEWSTRDLVAHVVDEQRWIPKLLTGCDHAQAAADLEPIGDDLAAEWARYAAAAGEAWQRTPADVPVHLSTDVVPAAQYLTEQTSDITIHTWDLARATGTEETLPPELVQAVWEYFEPQIEDLAATGLYAAPVDVTEDAPLQTRLLAVTGRDARVAA